MPKPSNPDKIVLKNNIYPEGLTAGAVYRYYNKAAIRRMILSYSEGKNILLFMSYDHMLPGVVRRNSNRITKEKIRLTEENYDDIISGYNISIACELEPFTNCIIIDMDEIKPSTNTPTLMRFATNVIVLSVKNDDKFPLDYDNKYKVFSSATGYHLYLYFRQKFDMEVGKRIMIDYLKTNRRLSKDYAINDVHNKEKYINLDFSHMRKRGVITIPHALNRDGTIYADITTSHRSSFKLGVTNRI